MSLLSREIEIYDFFRGITHWRYTDTDRIAIVESQTYLPSAIKRGRIAQSPEESKNNLELTVPLTLGLLDLYRPFPPTARVHLNLKRVRVSDGLVRQSWSGVISDVEDDDHTATIRCQTLMAAMGANGLRRCWQVPCPHALYSVGFKKCNANQDDFRVDTVLSDAAGVIVKSADFAAHGDGWFDGGFIRWQQVGDVDHRFIVSQVGDTLVLLTPAPLLAGAEVSAFPGCDHTLETCDEKFGNAVNYGGQHTIPVVNPMGNDPIF